MDKTRRSIKWFDSADFLPPAFIVTTSATATIVIA
jgi:hypothetical protein